MLLGRREYALLMTILQARLAFVRASAVICRGAGLGGLATCDYKAGVMSQLGLGLNCASLPYYVISGLFLGGLEPQFPHLESGDDNNTSLIYREDAYKACSQVSGSYDAHKILVIIFVIASNIPPPIKSLCGPAPWYPPLILWSSGTTANPSAKAFKEKTEGPTAVSSWQMSQEVIKELRCLV